MTHVHDFQLVRPNGTIRKCECGAWRHSENAGPAIVEQPAKFNRAEFEVSEYGTIVTPGKFQSEPIYVPYFYDLLVNSGATEVIDDGEIRHDVFVIDDDDRAEFPELADVYSIVLWTSESGFVNARTMTERELSNFRASCADSEPTEPGDDDITTTDHETFYQNGKRVLFMIRQNSYPSGRETFDWYYVDGGRNGYRALDLFTDDHKAALRAYMEKTQFWPNAWVISDHGNAHLIDLSEGK